MKLFIFFCLFLISGTVFSTQQSLDDQFDEYYNHRMNNAFRTEKNDSFTGEYTKTLEENSKAGGFYSSQVTYLNGKPNGKALWYDSKGIKELERTYVNGLIEGVQIHWFSDGERHETLYKNGIKDGLEVYFDQSNKKVLERLWKKGKLNGLETVWLDDGTIAKTVYKNGKEIGESKYYYPDITSKIKDRCQHDMGEHGYAMIKACVDQDLDSLSYIAEQLKANSSIAKRCMKTMQENGYILVKACIQQDLSAKEELDRY